ncbi:MAG: DUF371 domain-containing protein [Candidatus Aenigmatarchaeota archaeon]
MVEKVKSQEFPKPMPEITPEMIQTALKALEAKGMVYYTEKGVYIPTESGWKLLMEIKPVKEEIIAYGHPNITATHKTTFEVTKEENLGKEGSCIIGVRANKACKDLNEEFKNALKEGKKVEIIIEVEGISDKVIAFGSPALKLSDEKSIIVRKSDYIDKRTLAILSDKSACDIKREIVEKMKNPQTKMRIVLEVKG